MIPQIDSGKSWYSNFQYLPRLNQNNLRNKNIVKGLYFIDSPKQNKNCSNVPANLKIDYKKDNKLNQMKDQSIDNIYTFRAFTHSTPRAMKNYAFKNQQKFSQNYNKYMSEVNDQMEQLVNQQKTLSEEMKKDNQILVKQINFENVMDIN